MQASTSIKDVTATDKSYKVIRSVEDRFQIMNIQLEQGTFESMYVCWDNALKEVLTARVISKAAILQDARQSAQRDRTRDLHAFVLKNEVAILDKLDHENILKLHECAETPQHLYMFFEYCPKGSLHSIISKDGRLSFEQVMPLWRQLLRVTSYIHRSAIIHRDIRPRNIYMDQQGKLKLANFKSAYNFDENSSMQETVMERTAYMAPQIFAGLRVTAKMDVWSLGVTLFYMLYGCSPWPQLKETDWHRRLASSIYFPDQVEVPIKLKITIQKMLAYDPEMRVSLKELTHQFGI